MREVWDFLLDSKVAFVLANPEVSIKLEYVFTADSGTRGHLNYGNDLRNLRNLTSKITPGVYVHKLLRFL